jgi:hypothetical protein
VNSDAASPPDPVVIRRFEDMVTASGGVRMNHEQIWALWQDSDPAWASTWAARPRLSYALDQLARTGVIELPSRNGTQWDNALPPLPDRITVPGNRKASRRLLDSIDEPWCPALNQVPGWIRQARPPQQIRLDAAAINQWLLAGIGQSLAEVAREERSLHIFGNEKRLAVLEQGPLFENGRITLEKLACQAPLGAVRIARLSDTGPILIMENKSSFDSAWRALTDTPDPRYAAVVFGGGDAVITLVGDLVRLPELQQIQPTRIDYAGDVDIAGIETAALLAEATDRAGLPCRMALPLWDAVARSEPTGEDLTAHQKNRDPAIRAARQLGLPEAVLMRLRSGVRVPQERVDRTHLADITWWGL